MDKNKVLDFSVEKVELDTPKMDNADVQRGCWGDSGSDWANNC